MRRVALALAGTIGGLVMLLSFKTHSTTSAAGTPVATSTTGPDTTSGGGTSSTGTTSAPSSTAPSSSATAGKSSATKTVTGDAVDTRFGPVQVQITVTNGTLTAVNAIEYPQNDPRDAQINSYAIPQLNREALAAKSAKIDMVSGATYTSDGYISSLQSALDKAGV
jgi:uncharacterized protein with FMN-binding domain